MSDFDYGPSSRRKFIKVTTALAAAVAAPPQFKQPDIVESVSRRSGDPNRRILLRGGTIVSMDPKVGDFVKGDVLIQGKKIAAVGPNLQASGEVIDAANTILIPGFIDCHQIGRASCRERLDE